MAIGTIKKMKLGEGPGCGYGFISEESGPDHFFHRADLDPELDFDASLQWRRVEFTIRQTPKGTRAVAIRPAP